MKKLSILLIGLLLVSGFAAAWTGDGFDLSAEASATFGYDIDQNIAGITNAASVDLEWTLIEEQDFESEEEAEVYGWLKITEIEVLAEGTNENDDTTVDVNFVVGDIDARIILGPAYIDISETSLDVDVAGEIVSVGEIEMEDDDYTEFIDLDYEWDADPEFPGVAIGADLGIASFEASIASLFDWKQDGSDVTLGDLGYTDAGAEAAFGSGFTASTTIDFGDNDRNTENAYFLGLSATISAVENLTIEVESGMTMFIDGNGILEPSNFAAAGVGVSYDLPFGDLTITPEAAADFIFYNEADVAAFPFGVALGGDEETWMSIEAGAGVNILDADDNGVGLAVTYSSTQVTEDESLSALWVDLGFSEDAEDGLVPVLGAELVFNYAMFLPNEELLIDDAITLMAAGLYVSADTDVIDPYFGVVTGSTQVAEANGVDAVDFGATLKVGADIDVIPNTTFTLEWLSGDITGEEATGYAEDEFVAASGIDSGTTGDQFGTFAITTKISF